MLRKIQRLPIEHTFSTSATGEIHSAQWLTLPAGWLPSGFRPHLAPLQALGPFYFRRLRVLSWGLIQAREEESRTCLTLLGWLPLLCFAPAQVSETEGGGTVCYAITGGLILAPAAPDGGFLCMSLIAAEGEIRLGMEVKGYHSRISGVGTIWPFRRWLYEMTQARLHHWVANDFVRQLALALLSGDELSRFGTG